MSEIGDSLATAICDLQEFAEQVSDTALKRRIQTVVETLLELQLELDQLVN